MPDTVILHDRALAEAGAAGVIAADPPLNPDQVQPASVDLRLGPVAYRVRASFLPGRGRAVADRLNDPRLVMHALDLSRGAVLETGCVYVVPLAERLALPVGSAARMNPKSSTGRLDVFTRVITDGAVEFDVAPEGYSGPMYVEISPRTFSIVVEEGARLVQVRLRQPGTAAPGRSQTVSVDLAGGSDGCVGYRARRHAGVVRLADVGGHDPAHYWEPLTARDGTLVLDPGEFYILASKEAVRIAPDEAAEMAPIATEIGEFRAHYAGFFDPGFGCDEAGGAGARAVLEVRGRDVPFILEHGQPVAKLDFETMLAPPERLYGAAGSHYQAQGLKLGKHFRDWAD